jgi:hypothetical protein
MIVEKMIVYQIIVDKMTGHKMMVVKIIVDKMTLGKMTGQND